MEPELDGKIETALVDTGATLSHLGAEYINGNNYLKNLPRFEVNESESTAVIADGNVIRYLYKIKARFIVASTVINQWFVVCDKISNPIILGQDFMEKHKIVISYLNEKIYFNTNPMMLSAADYKIDPQHVSTICVAVPAYIRKHELICMQPAIDGLEITDSVMKFDSNGRYQKARILIKNSGLYPKYIRKNEEIGAIDFITTDKLFYDPKQVLLKEVNGLCNIKGKREGDTPNAYEPRPDVREIEFFEDKSIDIKKFNEITAKYKFKSLEDNKELTTENRNRLKYIILKNLKAFHVPDDPILKVNDYELKMELTDDTPWPQRFYPVHPTQKDKVDGQVDKMIRQGILKPIEECDEEVRNSPYISPCMILKKPGSETEVRLVSDVRELNKKLKPFPPTDCLSIEQSMIEIANMNTNYVSALDISSAYHAIPLTKDSLKYSIISISSRRLSHERMIMGSSTSAQAFNFYISRLMGTLYFRHLISYLDDLFLGSRDPMLHLKLLNEVFQRCIGVGLQLKAAKCGFFQETISYLGQEISKDRSIRPRDMKVKALLELRLPNSVKMLRRFLGLTNFFKNYIPDLAKIAAPLYKLTRGRGKNDRITLREEHVDAIHTLKKIMSGKPVIYLPNFGARFNLICDASNTGAGAILFQYHENQGKKEVRVIAYGSRLFTRCQERYTIWQKEALSLTMALLSWSNYICNSQVDIWTDNLAVKFLLQSPKAYNRPSQNRIMKWLIIYNSFRTTIHYVKSERNTSDILSRDLSAKGDSLISEENLNKYIDNRLSACQVNATDIMERLIRNGYKIENQMTPETVLKAQDKKLETKIIFKAGEENNDNGNRTEVDSDNEEEKKENEEVMRLNMIQCEKEVTKSKSSYIQAHDVIHVPYKKNEGERKLALSISSDKKEKPEKVKNKKSRSKEAAQDQAGLKEPEESKEGKNIVKERGRREKVISNTEMDKISNNYDIHKLQKEDTFCQQITNYLVNGKLPQGKDYARKVYTVAEDTCLANGLLYKARLNEGLRIQKNNGFTIILPKAIREEVLKEAHQETAHASESSLRAYLKLYYYWPGMGKDCSNFVRQCTVCNQFGRGYKLYQTAYVYCSKAFKHVMVDVAGPYHVSKSGYKYVLTTICAFTGYIVNQPIKTTTAAEICDNLMDTFLKLGMPVNLTADNATYFEGRFFKELGKVLGIHKIAIPVYSPWIIGRLEKTHQFLNERLAKLILEDPGTWDTQVKYVSYSMNNLVSARTGYSAHYLLFGSHINSPAKKYFEEEEEVELSVNEHVQYIRCSLNQALKEARDGSRQYIEKMLHDQRHLRKPRSYQPMDLVWIYKPRINLDISKKLDRRYQGPFVIREVYGDHYKVSKDLGSKILKNKISIQRIKPYYAQSYEPMLPTPEEEKEISQTEEPDLDEEKNENDLKDTLNMNETRDESTNYDMQFIPEIGESVTNQVTNKKNRCEETGGFTTTQQKESTPVKNEIGNQENNVENDSSESEKREQRLLPEKFITFEEITENKDKRRNPRRKTRVEHYNVLNELMPAGIKILFGRTKKPYKYLIQTKNKNEIILVTKTRISSEVVDQMHGKSLLELDEEDIRYLRDKYKTEM